MTQCGRAPRARAARAALRSYRMRTSLQSSRTTGGSLASCCSCRMSSKYRGMRGACVLLSSTDSLGSTMVRREHNASICKNKHSAELNRTETRITHQIRISVLDIALLKQVRHAEV